MKYRWPMLLRAFLLAALVFFGWIYGAFNLFKAGAGHTTDMGLFLTGAGLVMFLLSPAIFPLTFSAVVALQRLRESKHHTNVNQNRPL